MLRAIIRGECYSIKLVQTVLHATMERHKDLDLIGSGDNILAYTTLGGTPEEKGIAAAPYLARMTTDTDTIVFIVKSDSPRHYICCKVKLDPATGEREISIHDEIARFALADRKSVLRSCLTAIEHGLPDDLETRFTGERTAKDKLGQNGGWYSDEHVLVQT